MAVALEAVPQLMQQRWNLLSLGGGAMEVMVDEERSDELRNIKNIILRLGEDPRITDESENRWERVAASFVALTRDEALNIDLKDPVGSGVTNKEVQEFLELLGVDAHAEIVEGCPSRPGDSRLESMITVTLLNENMYRLRIHLSPKVPNDRRFVQDPGAINRLQQIALCPDGILRDVVTGLPVDRKRLRDELPSLSLEDIEMGERMVYMSRYILNLVRGLHHINTRGGKDDWMPDFTFREKCEFLVVASSIPGDIKRGKIARQDIEEFRLRMMASFVLNPKLFVNLAIEFDMHSVFPFFDEKIREKKVYGDLAMPKSVEEVNGLVRMIMNERYDANMSVIGNVAKMFGIGDRWWGDEVLE